MVYQSSSLKDMFRISRLSLKKSGAHLSIETGSEANAGLQQSKLHKSSEDLPKYLLKRL